MTGNEKNIIVTGGAGYIGSHACKALAEAGFTPICFDNLSRGHKWAVKWGPLEVGDILDENRLSDVLHKYKPSAVMHFAALSYVGESVTNPLEYYLNNVIGSYSLLKNMLSHEIEKIIFSSTCAVYGNPSDIPLTEKHIKNPINPYGNTKAVVENMMEDLSLITKIKYVSLRYFNAAGADLDGEIGELHNPETHLIPLVLQTAAGSRTHIDVYGNDYATPDGTCIRDYIHVTDLADAHIKALEYLLEGGKSNIYNLGTETGYSVNEIIDQASIITGKEIATLIAPRRPGDPPSLIADSTKIRQELNWKLRYSELGSILSTAWNWQHLNLDSSKP
jgi:UDP-arabinose 4-epimerase